MDLLAQSLLTHYMRLLHRLPSEPIPKVASALPLTVLSVSPVRQEKLHYYSVHSLQRQQGKMYFLLSLQKVSEEMRNYRFFSRQLGLQARSYPSASLLRFPLLPGQGTLYRPQYELLKGSNYVPPRYRSPSQAGDRRTGPYCWRKQNETASQSVPP